MVKASWPDMLEIFIINGIALLTELFDCFIHVNGVPDNDDVGDQVEASDLILELLIALASHLSLVSEEQVCPQRMDSLQLIELSAHSAAGMNLLI